MFYGRESELAELNNLYYKEGFQFPVVFGRRRVGKTRLLQEFCKDKKAVFYVAIEQNDIEALRQFSEVIKQSFPDDETLRFIEIFPTWDAGLRFVANKAQSDRIIIVIDEYPYLVNGNKSIPSLLQKLIDQVFGTTQLFLVLCGSSMSFMENEVLNYKSPLYGRRTAQFRIRPLDYLDSIKLLSKWKPIEQLYGYAVAGGIPLYLLTLGDHPNFKSAIIQSVLNPRGTLFEEPVNLMKQEMREPALYNSIIKAIASGASRQKDISDTIHEESKKIANYLSALIDLEIIEKQFPLDSPEGKKVIYRIKDNLFAYWYRFIPKALSLIEMGLAEEAYQNLIEPYFNNYFGLIFEDISRQYLVRLNREKRLPYLFSHFGKWWGQDPFTKTPQEIDIVASNDQIALFAECKWRNEKTSIQVFEMLKYKSQLTQKGKERIYYLFSKSGFTKGLIEHQTNQLHLVKVEEMLNL